MQSFHDPGEQVIVGAGEAAEHENIHILLLCSPDDLLRCLTKSCVDHLHAGVAESAGNHFHPTVVPVQTGLGHQDPDRLFGRHKVIPPYRIA